MARSASLLPILIAGAGICGLTAAIALARNGAQVLVVEQSPHPSPEGAGIQLGPNAVRVLRRLGLEQALLRHVICPDNIVIHSGVSGDELACLPVQSWSQEKYEEAYWVVHRAPLLKALFDTAQGMAGITIKMGFSVKGIETSQRSVSLFDDTGHSVEGCALIGTDGLWSHVRSHLFPGVRPSFFGKTAWRAVFQAQDAPEHFSEKNVGLWLGTKAHLVHYPLEGGAYVNVVAIIEEDLETQDWNMVSNVNELQAYFSDWAQPARDLLQTKGMWRRWSLFEHPALESWSRGRITLAGDAAHPVLPFLAQGGGMAIEDGEALARCVAVHGRNFDAAWQDFHQERNKRTARIQRASLSNGHIYHLSGIQALLRDKMLGLTPGRLLLSRYGWLYGFGAD